MQTTSLLPARGCPFFAGTVKYTKTASLKCPFLKRSKADFNYSSFVDFKIEQKKEDASYRYFNNINRLKDLFPFAHTRLTSNKVAVWCSNDYLAMSTHLKVTNAMQNAINLYGAGAGGTRNIAGNAQLHIDLESQLANLHNKQAALVFSSCYVANDATLSTLGSMLPNCVFFSDAGNHARYLRLTQHDPGYQTFKCSKENIPSQ